MSSAAAILAEQNRHTLARAKPFAAALHQAIVAQGMVLLRRYARGELRAVKSADGYRFEKEAAPEKQIGDLIERYGLRTARDANLRAQQLVLRTPTAREPIISEWGGYQIGIANRTDQVSFETESAFLREIQRVVEDAQANDFTPTHTEIARELRARLIGTPPPAGARPESTGFDRYVPGGLVTGFNGAFTYERAARIARTELAIAENTGAIEGYKDAGIGEIEWLGYRSPVWARRHDLMIGKKRKIDGPPFVLPSGETLRYPGDPEGDVSEIVHCRCSIAPAAKAKPKKPLEPVKPPEPINTPEPQPEAPPPVTVRTYQTRPLEYDGEVTAPRGNFEQGKLARAMKESTRRKADPAAESAIRGQLNELTASVGMISHDIVAGRSEREEYTTKRKLNGALGTHGWNGKISIDPTVHAQALKFLDGSEVTVQNLRAVRVLVHENVHAHSPMEPLAYQNAGRWIEEATTEIAARSIMNKHFDAEKLLATQHRDWDNPFEPYQSAIRELRHIVAEHVPDARERVEKASITMRQEKSKRFGDSDSYVRHFVDNIEGVDDRDALVAALKKVFDKYAG